MPYPNLFSPNNILSTLPPLAPHARGDSLFYVIPSRAELGGKKVRGGKANSSHGSFFLSFFLPAAAAAAASALFDPREG